MKNLLIILSLFVFASCDIGTVKADDLKSISFVPKSCSEPWDEAPYTANNESRGLRIIAYLRDKGIKDIYNFKSEQGPTVVCQACTCPSEELISFRVTNVDFEKLRQIAPFDKYLLTN